MKSRTDVKKKFIIYLTLQADISRLEQQEMELIQRLQNTQSMQKQAFDALEQALAADPQVKQ
jgi:hypothetical protein